MSDDCKHNWTIENAFLNSKWDKRKWPDRSVRKERCTSCFKGRYMDNETNELIKYESSYYD